MHLFQQERRISAESLSLPITLAQVTLQERMALIGKYLVIEKSASMLLADLRYERIDVYPATSS
jgi:hypothetical protein